MKSISVLLFCLSITSCNESGNKQPGNEKVITSINVDSLNAEFLAGWNIKDSVAIMKTIAENAVVMNDSLIHKGTDEIANNWISGGVKVLSNIKTVSSIREANETLAYDGGTYSLDLTPPGGPTLKERGNYSLVWRKQKVGDWKLTLIHIEDVTRMPDIK